jgi:hypothetical protein
MISVSTQRHFRIAVEVFILGLLAIAAFALLSAAGAQTRVPRPAPQPAAQTASPAAQVEEPVLRDYRGVQIGMSQEQARQRLGTPGDVSDRQDFYTFSGAESAQVFYDAQKRVFAVSVNYLGERSGAPAPEKVFGVAAAAESDGSVYKLVKYRRAGYFVVYSRSGGDAPPLVTVTMQRIID